MSASAADTTAATTTAASTTAAATTNTATQVRAAALAKYPGATIQRVETDSDGVYEAHLVTSSGARVTVELGKDFKVTGSETQGPPR